MEKKNTKKYTFSVEGETEKWYLEWLQVQINSFEQATYKVKIDSKVEQNPVSFMKSLTAYTSPEVIHLCDYEGKAEEYKFISVLDKMKKAQNSGKKIIYKLGYSNFSFELWIILHKLICRAPLTDKKQYLKYINEAFQESFESLDQYKKRTNFERCLSKLTLDDVITAILEAEQIMKKKEADPEESSVKYKGYDFYRTNPALTIGTVIRQILTECGIMKKDKLL